MGTAEADTARTTDVSAVAPGRPGVQRKLPPAFSVLGTPTGTKVSASHRTGSANKLVRMVPEDETHGQDAEERPGQEEEPGQAADGGRAGPASVLGLEADPG